VDLDACTGCKACVSACHSLNGLDEDEMWRSVGLIHSDAPEEPYQQTITTACHHCEDPACANGCPVLAYEKDAETGIVRHLDDQCIGCQYCVLKCPYDVPKYSKKRGIVRKCDMCQSRLAVGEAPACVQACPNEAIRIEVVRTGDGGASLVPGAFESSYTRRARVRRARILPTQSCSVSKTRTFRWWRCSCSRRWPSGCTWLFSSLGKICAPLRLRHSSFCNSVSE
jgi:Fe-S-cluster-containing dehydrogenase component